MRDPLKDKGRLQHMLDMALLLESEKTNHSLDLIKKDRVAFFGLSKIVEIIGEAAYKITKEYKAEHPELPYLRIPHPESLQSHYLIYIKLFHNFQNYYTANLQFFPLNKI